MKIDIVSVFPEYFDVLNLSLLGKAQEHGLLSIDTHDLRDWTHDVHHSVDDTPIGGGAGMVMKPEVWSECLDSLLGVTDDASDARDVNDAKHAPSLADIESADDAEHALSAIDPAPGTTIIFPNPSAPLFTQDDAQELSQQKRLIFGCGRYEGYDARIPAYYSAQGYDFREYSIGDYVLNGGEVAVSAMVEAITRLLPGFMGNPDSIVEESYTGKQALLEYRQYTRPAQWRGRDVPDILRSGDHAKVDRFRRDEALVRTANIRPDLIEQLRVEDLDKVDRKLLTSLGWDLTHNYPESH
ncbi:tRNA (guanosine(37)-N1)-methyltransferase TrmD [Bifidobacterium aquikefiri]|uniref:tRNA (guanosine(37)-N1)-methyltransferase TrmD n=1 Tax=Bifidobacterium aquikefiri TaxID=1653207 RepID=UPI0039ED729C